MRWPFYVIGCVLPKKRTKKGKSDEDEDYVEGDVNEIVVSEDKGEIEEDKQEPDEVDNSESEDLVEIEESIGKHYEVFQNLDVGSRFTALIQEKRRSFAQRRELDMILSDRFYFTGIFAKWKKSKTMGQLL